MLLDKMAFLAPEIFLGMVWKPCGVNKIVLICSGL